MNPTTNTDHKQAAIVAMAQAGIPDEFQSPGCTLEPLEALGQGVRELRERLKSAVSWRDSVLLVTDTGQKMGVRVAYLAARAMVLRGVSVQCMTLPRLVEQVERSEHALCERLADDVDVLVVTGFCEPGVSEGNPYDKRLAHRLEWFFDGQLSRGRGLVLHTTGTLNNPARVHSWWSKRLVNRLMEKLVLEVTV